MKEVYIGADHAGFELKENIKLYLKKKGYEVYDEGAFKIDKLDDYPDFAIKVAEEISDNLDAKGVLCCGSSQGMCIVANKFPGVRAVSVTNTKEAIITRTHNNANVLCLSGWRLSRKRAIKILDAWLNTEFSNESRHIRRLKKITNLENHKRQCD